MTTIAPPPVRRSAPLGALVATALLALTPAPLPAQARITGPVEALGFTPGDDYRLATYTQLTDWWRKLDAESDRLRLVSIGRTAEGRDQWMMIITAPANFARLDRLRDISARLARAEGLTDDQARALAAEGRAVVWIDGGLHSTEVLGAHQLMEHVWQMATRTDAETMRLLDDVIQLVVHANPDGMELVSGWYMRQADPSRRTTAGLPRLYQKYIGHDNNRDLFMNAMPESKNMSRVMYREWHPQIMYNHHQTGPAGAVMFAPPFRDPHNHLLEPLLISSLNMVGNAMHARFAAENKPGVVQREAAGYQTWWNGGLRTTAYFHNIVGILTETIGSPTPGTIPVVPGRLVPTGTDPFPITPQPWTFRQSVEYSITANRAILDHASRYREQLLYHSFLMGRAAIEKGSRDHWTHYPGRVARLEAAARGQDGAAGDFRGTRLVSPALFQEWMRRPEDRDPRGYVLPADQPDFLTATKFVNALIESGVDVHHATQAFAVHGTRYPAGSYVIRTAQAFRAHVLDMLEPQDYPNDFAWPGGPPRPPYDNAGYTLAMQMGVRYDRIREAFDCPCVRVADVLPKPPVPAALPRAGTYALSRRVNDAYLAVNRLLAAGQRVEVAPGSAEILVPATGEATRILRDLVETRGLPVASAGPRPAGAGPLRPARVGLWDQYGGSMPSGWIRWMLEQFEFPFEVVYAPALDQGNLRQRFDVLVFVGGAIPAPERGNEVARRQGAGTVEPADLPPEYRDRVGRVTAERTVPQLRAFLEAGGRIVTIGTSTALARHLGLPVESHLVERSPDGTVRPLPRDRFYVPGSLLEVAVDSAAQSAAGMPARAIVMFDESPVFRLPPDAGARGLRPVMWFDSAEPLRSGWAWGQTFLDGGVAAVEATVGRGTLYLFGPEITFRSQPHGTYRLLFNALWGR
jgi:hypothetical protein